jgi:hypothetical protein
MAATKRKPKPTKRFATPARSKPKSKVARATKRVGPKLKSTEGIWERAGAQPGGGALSKQDNILGMLRQTEGTTIAAITEATGWKTHSVRGFFAGIVKKKLKLNLASEKIDGVRVYRINESGRAA